MVVYEFSLVNSGLVPLDIVFNDPLPLLSGYLDFGVTYPQNSMGRYHEVFVDVLPGDSVSSLLTGVVVSGAIFPNDIVLNTADFFVYQAFNTYANNHILLVDKDSAVLSGLAQLSITKEGP